MKRYLLISLLLAGCAVDNSPSISIDSSKTYQTIDGFGASDAWTIQFSDKWPAETVERAADLLFSQDKGIGLSIWRFNLGAGSTYQGDDAQIQPMTRTECFLMPDGSWDFDKQKAQVDFMKMAKERGVNTFIAFLNSPPVYFTQNGLATNTGRGGDFNLKPECYGKFADYMAKSAKGLAENHGIDIDYICPVNEPDGHWNWQGPKQEGSPATNAEIAHITRELDEALTRENLGTKILVNESSDYRAMVSTHQTDADRGFAIQTLFNADSASNVVGLKHVEKLIAGHGYWTNTPLDFLRTMRENLNDTLTKFGVKFWMTEQCIMGNDEEIGGGQHFDTTMKTALYVARCIHHDLVFANASSWQWWRAIGEDYRDGLLEDFGEETIETGKLVDSRLLWCMGNYSRFVRPGAVRVGVSVDSLDSATDSTSIMASAYRNIDGSIVCVIINYSDTDHEYSIDGIKPKTMYVTSDESGFKLKPIELSGKKITIPARSMVTVK